MNPDLIPFVIEMAAALMKPSEIAVLLDFNSDEFSYIIKNKPESPFTIAYNKGRYQTKFELRKKIIQLAKAGSPQAELLADKYLSQE